jgi:hypothetical protein
MTIWMNTEISATRYQPIQELLVMQSFSSGRLHRMRSALEAVSAGVVSNHATSAPAVRTEAKCLLIA